MTKDEKKAMLSTLENCLEVALSYYKMDFDKLHREAGRIKRLKSKIAELEGGKKDGTN